MNAINRFGSGIILLFAITVTSAKAQYFEINPFAGYTLPCSYSLKSGGTARIGDGFTYGAAISSRPCKKLSVEIRYMRQDCSGRYRNAFDYNTGAALPDQNSIPMSCNFVQLGICRFIPLGITGNAEGFAGVDLGAVAFKPKEDYNTKWMLSPELKAGARIWPSKNVGLHLQIFMNVPFQREGRGIFSGQNNVSTGVSSLKLFPLFGMSGGISFRFGKAASLKDTVK
jgi:hypothetical protein